MQADKLEVIWLIVNRYLPVLESEAKDLLNKV